MSAPIARLAALSDEEKTKLSAILKQRLLLRSFLFFLGIFVSIAVIVYFNRYGHVKSEDNLGLINVVFIVMAVLCARLLYAEFSDYGKEIGSPNKRIIRTRMSGKKGSKIVLGNKTFSKENILLDSSAFDSLQGNEEVQLELSAKSNIIFSVKKAAKE
jgi:hypothetical protein